MSTADPAVSPAADQDVSPVVDQDVVARPAAFRPDRLISLDVLRGVTIAFMIFVNTQAGPQPFVEFAHAPWNGFTLTDLVFPTFLFLVGISTVLSTASRLARGATKRELFLHTLRRAVLLIAFGFVVNNAPYFHMATARYYGVLPRIGICYFVVATLYLLSSRAKDKLAIAIACLLGYWLLMRFVPVPGYGVPTHTVAINDPDGNLGAWLDRQIFSAPHLYERVRDPEGLLSTLPAIATALIGMLTGFWLRTRNTTGRKAALIAVAGVALAALGLLWNPWFPINKKLWTSSYVLFAGGLSLLLLALSIWVVDILRLGREREGDPARPGIHPPLYRPILVFGTNAILAYMISEVGADLLGGLRLPSGSSSFGVWQKFLFGFHLGPQWSSSLFAASFVLLCWLLVLPFYRRRIFLRL